MNCRKLTINNEIWCPKIITCITLKILMIFRNNHFLRFQNNYISELQCMYLKKMCDFNKWMSKF